MKVPPRLALSLSLVFLAIAIACSHSLKPDLSARAKPVGKIIKINPPLGLPAVPVPLDNPPTADAIALGRKLFYDQRLSFDTSMSCASCHNPRLSFTDGKPHSTGFGGKQGTRNAPTVLNAAYDSSQFWDGRAPSLEVQAGMPIANPIEMNMTHEVCVEQLGNDPQYKAAFEKTYGPGPVTIGKVESALASYERTLISADSPFDRYEYGGDKKALTESAIRGLDIFRDPKKGNCAVCHEIGAKSATFNDGKFHNIGTGVDADGNLTDLGRFLQTGVASDKGAFKTPSLRNVANTGPYMHDGSVRTLKDVVDFYAGGGNSNPYLDKEIKEIKLSGRDRADLVAFLESLTGKMPADAGPPEPVISGGTK
jgi:cytochrome c peroxidase